MSGTNVFDMEAMRKKLRLPPALTWKDIIKQLPAFKDETLAQGQLYDEASAKRLEELVSKLNDNYILPSLGVEEDGMLNLEWITEIEGKRTSLLIICAPSSYIYAYLENGKPIGGASSFGELAIRQFNAILSEHFILGGYQNANKVKTK